MDQDGLMVHEHAELEPLSRSRCLALLASVPVGRVVYTDAGLPAVRPVNFVLHHDEIVIRTEAGSRLAGATDGAIVAFEVDEIDADRHGGWSVVVTGHASNVRDKDELRALERLPLHSWAPGRKDHFIRIHPDLVSGRLLSGEAPRRTAPLAEGC